ncbi:MAG: flagellar protein FlaG [Desulfamplus sp.]|nr:flagellar protein FlaG [Desulfamplus sp.]
MNINPIRAGEGMNVVSPSRSVKQPESQPQDIKAQLSNQTSGTDTENQLKTEQNKQLKNNTKLQGKQKEDDKKQPNIQDAQKMVDELNDYMDELQTSLGFSVTRDSENPNQIIFQIKDRTTDEVIRQIPSEEIQKIKEKMNELTGLLLDQHA